MLKLVIIDDERLVRLGMKTMVPWEEHGFMLVGEAANGQAGLELIAQTQPDLVITDIVMPVMDGITMMAQVLKTQKRVKFVVLSSHDEFTLAKQALKLGALDYFIKMDVEPEAMTGALSRVKELLSQEAREHSERYRLERQIRANLPVMREEFFKKLISQMLPGQDEIMEEMEMLDIRLDMTRIFCISVKVNNLSDLGKYTSAADMKHFEFTMLNIMDELINEVFTGYAFAGNLNKFVAVCSATEEGTELRNRQDQLAARLRTILMQYVNMHVSVGFSSVCHGETGMRKAYGESLTAADRTFFSDQIQTLHFEDIGPETPVTAAENLTKLRETLSRAIDARLPDLARQVFMDVTGMLKVRKLSREQVCDVCAQMYFMTIMVIPVNLVPGRPEGNGQENIYTFIGRKISIEDVIAWMEELRDALCKGLAEWGAAPQGHPVVSRVCRYITEHCHEEITLNGVALRFNISSSYLSGIFRTHTGKCFTDYVNEVRVEKAKELLRTTEYRIYEICDMLQYENQGYFSRIFKKLTDMTPSEYAARYATEDRG